MLDSFNMLNFVDFLYKLKLSETMHIYDVFHFKLLCLVINDFLPDQKNDSSRSIVINDENEWKIDDILNSWWYWRQLQYQVKWKNYNNDLNWYNIDDDEFINTQNVVDDFYTRYSDRAH